MKIGVLGTGIVGENLATKMVQLGHEVKMGSRSPGNEKAVAWAKNAGNGASYGTFADAVAFGEIIFNCTHGSSSIEALKSVDEKDLYEKVLVDVSNPLDFSGGELKLTISNTDSLGEQIQRAFPRAKVVKALNTVNAYIQVNPALLEGEHDVFMCGNDASAKSTVKELLKSFGWKNIIDLGDIRSSRGQEALMLMFMSLTAAFPKEHFNYHVLRGTG
ncbi:MAG: NADPH-dependent F420 reductase [Candidatus Micrarchaeaceae archaeon]